MHRTPWYMYFNPLTPIDAFGRIFGYTLTPIVFLETREEQFLLSFFL